MGDYYIYILFIRIFKIKNSAGKIVKSMENSYIKNIERQHVDEEGWENGPLPPAFPEAESGLLPCWRRCEWNEKLLTSSYVVSH